MNTADTGKPKQGSEDFLSHDSDLLIVSDNEERAVVRQSFRVPVPEGMVTFAYAGQTYTVIDLSMYGVGVSVNSPDAFVIGDTLEKAHITFPDTTFSVDTEIIHISPHSGDTLLCGMEIIRTHDTGFVDWMTRVITEIKSTVLASVTKSK